MIDRARTLLRRPALLLLLWAAIVWSPAAFAQDDTFPETTVEAMHLYEEEFPPEDWLDGPVQYLILGYERDIWKDLEDDEARQKFKAWFWGRRDPDPRDDETPLMAAFYERVAYANQRFSGFPKGWRSDRGRVFITLGPPTGGMRRTRMTNFGRCGSNLEGEWWTYYTNNMSFQAQFGEFNVIFVETRVNTYEICDPSMLGVGGMPIDLGRAIESTKTSLVLDDTTEFGADTGDAIGDTVATYFENTEELDVPDTGWGEMGVAGSVVVPLSLPFRKLLFEPQGDQLVATLGVEATLVALGEGQGRQGIQSWTVALDSSAGASIAGASLQTAVVLPADPGAYSVTIQVADPLSGTAWRWEGPVEVSADGVSVTPPLIGDDILQLRESGEVAVVGPANPTVESGERFAVVSWVRGVTPEVDGVTLELLTADGQVTELEIAAAIWGNQAAAGPLIVEASATVPAGEYLLRLSLGPDGPGAERRLSVR
jgi:GWxTD domain-containing protein